ncbi:MAG: hypothetical protein H7323_09525 [Frankiales bacterium]|nr:hypothetical protein [Frankiales bacterium]
MWRFGRRRRRGRHALGAAVVDAPAVVPVSLAGSIAELIASGQAWADPGVRPASSVPGPMPAWGLVAESSVSRVQLGFRDGSTASLDPAHAAALQELAGLLTSRD